MSLYHSVQVNSDYDPVIVEVSNVDWKIAYYRREQKKKVIGFLFCLIIVSGCVAYFWSQDVQLKRQEAKNFVVLSNDYFQPEHLPQLASSSSSSTTTPKPSCLSRVVAYYPGNGRRKITPSQLSKLTHVAFSSLILNSNGSVSFRNKNEEERFFELKRIIESKNSNVKLMISVEEDGVDFSFSKVSADAQLKKTFLDSVSSFLMDHGLEGIDLNWKFPYREELLNQKKFIKELRENLSRLQKQNKRTNPYLISIVVPALGKTTGNAIGENLENLLEFVDFVNIMSFDYSIFYHNHTGPNAPLYSSDGSPNVNSTVAYYSRKEGSLMKLNLGLAFHGTYWNNVGEPIDGEIWKSVGTPRGYMESGQVTYRNIEKEGWNESMASWDDQSKTPFVMDKENKRLLSFENRRSLKKKGKYARKMNLGGLAIWSLEMDDEIGTLLETATSDDVCT